MILGENKRVDVIDGERIGILRGRRKEWRKESI